MWGKGRPWMQLFYGSNDDCWGEGESIKNFGLEKSRHFWEARKRMLEAWGRGLHNVVPRNSVIVCWLRPLLLIRSCAAATARTEAGLDSTLECNFQRRVCQPTSSNRNLHYLVRSFGVSLYPGQSLAVDSLGSDVLVFTGRHEVRQWIPSREFQWLPEVAHEEKTQSSVFWSEVCINYQNLPLW